MARDFSQSRENCISNTSSHDIALRTTGKKTSISKKLSKHLLGTKRTKRRFIRYSLITANLLLLGGVGAFVVNGAQRSSTVEGSVAASYAAAAKDSEVVGPLDQVSSIDIAVNVARVVDLPEAVAVTNQSDSVKILNAVAPADTAVVAKPQIVATDVKSGQDIQTYVAVEGDTITSIAAKFGITSDSVRWSNDITGDSVQVGKELAIPPVNGIVYTVRVGDTPESIANEYKANQARIISFNDAELSGLAATQKIVIPDGQKPAPVTPVYRYAAATSFNPVYGYNGYDYGWCTWYVANKISVPTGWGNANTWDNRARVTPGWTVSSTPVVGAVAQTDRGGLGHVAVVEEVYPDGSIRYSDMNGVAGWGRVGERTVPASYYSSYIVRQ